MTNYCKESLEGLSYDAKHSIEVIERKMADSSTRDAIYWETSTLPSSLSARLTLYNIAKIVSIVKGDSISGLMPEAIKLRRNPLAIETVFLFAGMVAERCKSPQILGRYFEIVNKANSDLEAKELGGNLIHTVIQAINEGKDRIETLKMMDDVGSWKEDSPFFWRRRNPPLLFSPSKAIVETFSVERTMEEIRNQDVSKMLTKYSGDPFAYRIIAWNARMLNNALDSISGKYMEERQIEEKVRMKEASAEDLRCKWHAVKDGLLCDTNGAVTSYKYAFEAQSALWLIATIAKRTRNRWSISRSCDFVEGLAGSADELRATSNFFVDALSHMSAMQHTSVGNLEMIKIATDALCEIKNPKKAEAFACQVAIAAGERNERSESRIIELCGKIAFPERRDSMQAASKTLVRQAS